MQTNEARSHEREQLIGCELRAAFNAGGAAIATTLGMKSEGENVASAIKPQTLRIVMSSALYWAWIFLLYWSPLLLGSGWESLYAKGAAFLGSATAFFIWFVVVRAGRRSLFDRVFSRMLPFVLTPLAGLGALVNALAGPLPLALLLVLWFLAGFGAAFILVRVSHLMFREGQENTSVVMFVMLFVSCLVAVFASQMPISSVGAAVTMALLPVASFSFVQVRKRVPSATDELDDIDAPESKSRVFEGDSPSRRSFFVSLVQMFFYSMAFSFALLTGLYSSGGDMSSMYVWFGVFLAGIVVMFYGMWFHRRVKVDLMQLILLGVAVVGLAPFALANVLPAEVRYASCVLLMLGFTSYDMLGLSHLLSTISAQDVSFTRYFVLGRFGNAFGVFAGWALAAASLAATSLLENQLVAQALPLVLIVVLTVLVMVCSYWGQWGSGKASKDAAAVDSIGVWRRSCEDLCDAFGLSSREREVFALCAKGRDSAYICSALYISAHTVKSHVYHIYNKMDIHSQQELISMVEQRAEDLKKGASQESKG